MGLLVLILFLLAGGAVVRGVARAAAALIFAALAAVILLCAFSAVLLKLAVVACVVLALIIALVAGLILLARTHRGHALVVCAALATALVLCGCTITAPGYILQRPLTVFHILLRVLLPHFQVATFALHLVGGLSALSAGNLLALPRQLPVLLLNL